MEHDTPPGITRLLRLWLALGTDASASMATEAYRCFQERYQITNSALSLNRTIHAAIQQCQLAETPLRAQPTRTHRLMTLRFTLSDAMASLPP